MAKGFKHKYEEEVGACTEGKCPCPPKDAVPLPKPTDAFRFVFSDCKEDSFIPQAVSSPENYRSKPCEKACRYHSLSFYISDADARAAYAYFTSKFRQFGTRSGDHLANGTLDSVDGISTPLQSGGHFEFYADEAAVFHPKFRCIGKL